MDLEFPSPTGNPVGRQPRLGPASPAIQPVWKKLRVEGEWPSRCCHPRRPDPPRVGCLQYIEHRRRKQRQGKPRGTYYRAPTPRYSFSSARTASSPSRRLSSSPEPSLFSHDLEKKPLPFRRGGKLLKTATRFEVSVDCPICVKRLSRRGAF